MSVKSTYRAGHGLGWSHPPLTPITPTPAPLVYMQPRWPPVPESTWCLTNLWKNRQETMNSLKAFESYSFQFPQEKWFIFEAYIMQTLNTDLSQTDNYLDNSMLACKKLGSETHFLPCGFLVWNTACLI